MDSVVHFEIPFDDAARVKKFYTDSFGWKITDVPGMDYVMVETIETDQKTQRPIKPGGINGGMLKRKMPGHGPTLVINVDDIDAAVKKSVTNGAKLVVEKMKVGDMGWTAYLTDTEGNTFGLWQSAG